MRPPVSKATSTDLKGVAAETPKPLRQHQPRPPTHYEPSGSVPERLLGRRAGGGRFWHGFAVRRPPVCPPGDLVGSGSISGLADAFGALDGQVGAEEMRDEDHIEIERLLSPEDVARACGLSRRAVYRAIARGELRAARLCHRLRVHPAELERWIAEETHGANQSAPMRSSRRLGGARRGSLRVLLDEAAEG